MSEREHRVDLIAIEEHLQQPLEDCYDAVIGDGVSLLIPRGEGFRPLSIQIFPDARIARLHTTLTDLTLRRAEIEVNEVEDALGLKGATEEEWVRVHVWRSGVMIVA